MNTKIDLNQALEAHRQGRLGEAETLYRQAWKTNPNEPQILNLLGTVLAQQNRLQDARSFLEKAYKITPNSSGLVSNYGHLLILLKDYKRAKQVLDHGLKLDPNSKGMIDNYLKLMRASDQADEAIKMLNSLISKAGQTTAYHHLKLAEFYCQKDEYTQAIKTYKKAQSLPDFSIDQSVNFLQILHGSGEVDSALDLTQAQLALHPFLSGYHALMGVFSNEKGHKELARINFEKSFASEKMRNGKAGKSHMLNLAKSYSDCRKHQDAKDLLQDIMKVFGADEQVVMQLLSCYTALGEFANHDELLKTARQEFPFDKIREANFCHKESLALRLQHRFDEALKCVNQAIDYQPEHVEYHITKSLLLLVLQRFKEGWREYLWRWKSEDRQISYFQEALKRKQNKIWNGQDSLANKRLLLFPEQGYGDFINFSRCIFDAATKAKSVSVPMTAPLDSLISLFQPSMPKNVRLENHVPDFDKHDVFVSMIDYLGYCWPENDQPDEVEKLTIRSAYQQQIKTYMAKFVDNQNKQNNVNKESGKLKIGLCISGNPEHFSDKRRSISMDDWQPLLNLSHDFYLLQNQVKYQDQQRFKEFENLYPIGLRAKDFLFTAALIEEMDLVISVDTSIAHLAAHQGKPTWMLLAINPDWRWGIQGNTTRWYKSMTLYRQSQDFIWQPHIKQIIDDLANISVKAS